MSGWVAREESVAADPDDQTAVETVGAAYEAWVGDIGYDPATTDMAGGELEAEEGGDMADPFARRFTITISTRYRGPLVYRRGEKTEEVGIKLYFDVGDGNDPWLDI
ncbi:hypothetical protein [Halalkalicoccus tibetensis]|uniref:Uncharacterized protein n=1 Tax=Halalkalicoccus tibetensis TaxID=175632 RepID=A0ABD5VA90_9EURY